MKRHDWIAGKESPKPKPEPPKKKLIRPIEEAIFRSMRTNEQQREELLIRAISNNGVTQRLAEAMAAPVRRNLDYSGIMRRVVTVENI